MDENLVDETQRKRLLHHGGAEQTDGLAARRRPGLSIALTTPSITNVNADGYDLLGK